MTTFWWILSKILGLMSTKSTISATGLLPKLHLVIMKIRPWATPSSRWQPYMLVWKANSWPQPSRTISYIRSVSLQLVSILPVTCSKPHYFTTASYVLNMLWLSLSFNNVSSSKWAMRKYRSNTESSGSWWPGCEMCQSARIKSPNSPRNGAISCWTESKLTMLA